MASRPITSGPGKFDLMAAEYDNKEVRFTFAEPVDQLPAHILGTDLIDRETETRTIRGYAIHHRPIQQHQRFSAAYSTDTRTGTAEFNSTCDYCGFALDIQGFCL